MKLSWRTWSCIWALSFGTGACGVSDAELPQPPGTYNGSAGISGEADEPDAPSAGAGTSLPVAGRVSDAGSGSVLTGSAGQGGSAPRAGAGGIGAGGGSAAVGGNGAVGTGGHVAAGSGGAGGTGGASANDSCPADYTMATHIVINVSWKGTLALAAGSGKVHVWTKSQFHENGSNASIVSKSCGSVLPAITTTSFAGSEKILPEIPDSAWDAPNMPTFTGTGTRSSNSVSVDPGVALIGLTMSDPKAAWPAATSISGVDHDGDGKSGLTATSKQTDGFSAVPTNITRTSRADKVYLAIRNVMTLTATAPECADSYSGTANVSNFENHVIGCHVKGGNECDSTQSKFVDDNRTVYVLGSATFTSERIADSATCADVRAALPL